MLRHSLHLVKETVAVMSALQVSYRKVAAMAPTTDHPIKILRRLVLFRILGKIDAIPK
jgi:hypothetical protein